MFDISFTELLVIGVIALVVIGPERLPKVARTIGHLVGRAQRYVSDVKTDIQREVELDELRKLKDQMQDAAQSVKSSLQNTETAMREPLEAFEQSTMATINELKAPLGTPDIGVTPAVSAQTPAIAAAQASVAQPPTQLEIDALRPAAHDTVAPVTVAANPETTPGSKS
ncbi:Sec-independent protein translocase protein TatB [Zwartia vadi]|uniref:Sec-independent protein translocase protein TatB n=1 Tax=Zwartia vadi TaxID=3058168 RepID=UPI0025B5EB58|nr:Sec-independent protein translocase protein TatB [Zwartia vadi]MDN3987793.1 Sec-independent protein translocase protein TatB [Zwartia vadi]